MKKKLFLYFMTVTLSGLIVSCQSHSTKPNNIYPAQNTEAIANADANTSVSTNTTTDVNFNPVSTQTTSTPPHSGVASLNKTSVTCDGDACPDAVALIQINFGNTIRQCTGFLTTPNVIATNSHCLPESWTNQFNCTGKLDVTFPKTGSHSMETLGCQNIIKRTTLVHADTTNDKFSGVLDLALLKLDQKTRRTPLVIDPTPIADGSRVIALKVNPLHQNMMTAGKIEMATFDVNTWTTGGQNPFLALSPIDPATHIRDGNSGSPIIDDQGNVRGILQGPLYIDNVEQNGKGMAKVVPCISGLMSCLK